MLLLKPGKALDVLLPFLVSGFLFSCNSPNDSAPRFTEKSIEGGRVLAASHCQSCHSLPDPSLLDKNTWQTRILPLMGPHIGIFEFNGEIYPSKRHDKNLARNFYPSRSMITARQWQDLIDYYVTRSPDTMPSQKRSDSIRAGLSLFSVKTPVLNYTNPTTCVTKIDTSTFPHQLWVGDILKKNLYRFNDQLSLTDSIPVKGPVVDISIQDNKIVTCNIGSFHPSTSRSGEAQIISRYADRHAKPDTTQFDGLARPVQVLPVDLDMDGREDYVICEFGYLTGALSWYKNSGNGYEHRVIKEMPGAIKVVVTDYNNDGLPDLWVLFSQGEEGIFLFTNKGNGMFNQEELLRFPPSYGSSYFELDDFNNDGFPDIVYTCGDNGDYKPVLKPYHGVYIFMNDKKNHFEQKYFFPINGCYKAVARDFDGDGDLDIATIAFFSDIRQPEEGFVYLENKGDFTFVPFTLPGTKSGRWLTMDVGDIDGDGKPDIVLGNCSFGPNIKGSVYEYWKRGPSFILLKNTGIKKIQSHIP